MIVQQLIDVESLFSTLIDKESPRAIFIQKPLHLAAKFNSAEKIYGGTDWYAQIGYGNCKMCFVARANRERVCNRVAGMLWRVEVTDGYPTLRLMVVCASFLCGLHAGWRCPGDHRERETDYIVPEVEAIATRTLMELEEEGLPCDSYRPQPSIDDEP